VALTWRNCMRFNPAGEPVHEVRRCNFKSVQPVLKLPEFQR
jgi:hypothetical protein